MKRVLKRTISMLLVVVMLGAAAPPGGFAFSARAKTIRD